jgi:hypothetical protein
MYQRALEVLHAAGLRHSEGLFLAALGAVDAESGRRADARLAFAEADVLIRASGDPTLRTALCVHQLHLALLEARAAASERDARLAELRAQTDQIEQDVGGRSEDVRLALRIFARAMREADQPSRPELTLGPQGRWFHAPGETVAVDLSRRAVLRRVLTALADARQHAPGTPVPADQLLAAAWPGERVIADAGAHRVRVAIATLRKLGLRDVLQHDDGGYLLDAGVTIRRA